MATTIVKRIKSTVIEVIHNYQCKEVYLDSNGNWIARQELTAKENECLQHFIRQPKSIYKIEFS